MRSFEKKKVRKPRKEEPILWDLRYQPAVYESAINKQVGGNFPIGGVLIAEVDDELLDVIKKYYPNADIRVGDKIRMDNGWTLD